MLEKHNTLFLLFQEIEALDNEIKSGNHDMKFFWTEANEQLESMISEIIDENPDFIFYGSNIVRKAFEIVYKTL